MIRLFASRTIAAGLSLVVASLVMRHVSTGTPNCIIAACFAAGAILMIFQLGKASIQAAGDCQTDSRPSRPEPMRPELEPASQR